MRACLSWRLLAATASLVSAAAAASMGEQQDRTLGLLEPEHSGSCGGMSCRHITVLSIGERPFFEPIVRPRIEAYAKRVGASVDFLVDRQVPLGHALATQLGVSEDMRSACSAIPNRSTPVPIAFCLKLYAAGKALAAGHKHVLSLDDTIFVMPHAQDVFTACPPGAQVCGFSEGLSHNKVSQGTFHAAGHYAKQHAHAWGTFGASEYLNTGVVVWSEGKLTNTLLSATGLTTGARMGKFNGPGFDQTYVALGVAAAVAEQRRRLVDVSMPAEPPVLATINESFNRMLLDPRDVSCGRCSNMPSSANVTVAEAALKGANLIHCTGYRNKGLVLEALRRQLGDRPV